MAEGGVDLLLIETVSALNEAEQAILAAKSTAPTLPVLVMVTVDEDANCLDGSSPETAAARLTEWGADAIGCNCSVGPATVLTAIERMAAVTDLPLIAMPNAGMPRAVEGRNIYLCSPEYMASFARKLVKAGVQFVGGCCGTTPSHIRSMKSSLRAMDAMEVAHHAGQGGSGCVRDRARANGRAFAPGCADCQRHLCHHGGDGSPQGHHLRTRARRRPRCCGKAGSTSSTSPTCLERRRA